MLTITEIARPKPGRFLLAVDGANPVVAALAFEIEEATWRSVFVRLDLSSDRS